MSLRSKLSRLEEAAPLREAVAAVGSPLLEELRARIEATLARTALKGGAGLGAHRGGAERMAPADVELPFDTEPTAAGVLHARTRRLPPSSRTGRFSIAPAHEARTDLLALLAVDPRLAGLDPRRALYLDTETTGLSGGAGTLAFLVGLAFWDETRGLVVEQLFVRAPGEEAPVLERVRERLAAASMLVTYNGKSFDLPLLRTRFVMSRMELPPEPPHLDLLHVARRVHGKRLREGCRLQTIEREVLGFERVDDVPSAEVGERYLHFLRTGDPSSLVGVVEHNGWDVITMAALVGLYGEALEGGLGADDLVGVARTLRRAGALDRAHEAAEAAVAGGAGPESLRARAEIAKARGDRASALADFEALAATADDARARLELAKLYEHWVKAPARALEWTAQGTGEAPERQQRRAERLARKVDRVSRSS